MLVCLILTAVILVQFKAVEETDITGIKTAQESELKTMLSSWKTNYEEAAEKLSETEQKIQEYEAKMSSDEEAEELLDEELMQTNILAGKTDVSGQGIIVTLSQNNEKEIVSEDLIRLVNELRLADVDKRQCYFWSR